MVVTSNATKDAQVVSQFLPQSTESVHCVYREELSCGCIRAVQCSAVQCSAVQCSAVYREGLSCGCIRIGDSPIPGCLGTSKAAYSRNLYNSSLTVLELDCRLVRQLQNINSLLFINFAPENLVTLYFSP
jgi:hypothetical protein